MIEVNANKLSMLPLGRQGENLARRVVSDVADLEAEYGPGTVELITQRPGDKKPYPAAVKREDTRIIWDITSAETAANTLTQSGKCELRY